MTAPSPDPGVPFEEAVRTWGRIGLQSFGGPAGQIAVMHRILVEEKRWVAEDRFLHALKFTTLLPGPEAQQLITYLGWLSHGTRGGLVAGSLFILPGLVTLFGLSLAYVAFGGTAWLAGLFGGLKPAVLAIVVAAVLKIGRRALGAPILRVMAIGAFLALFLFKVPFPAVVLGAGLVGALVGGGGGSAAPPGLTVRVPWSRTVRVAVIGLALWWGPIALIAAGLGARHVLTQQALLFSKSAVVTFGGAYAVLSYVAQQAVARFGWLKPEEMIDGLAMAETTPGPLIMVLQFVGFVAAYRSSAPFPPLLAAMLGTVVTVWATFVPSFLFVLLGAPYVESLRHRRRLAGALSGVSAAVVGVIANLSVWFSLHVLFRDQTPIVWGPMAFEWPVWASFNLLAGAIGLGAAIATFRYRWGIGVTLGAAAVVGFVGRLLAG